MLIQILVQVLVLLLVAGIIYAIIDAIWPGDVRFKRIGMAVLGLIILLYVLNAFGLWGSGGSRLFR